MRESFDNITIHFTTASFTTDWHRLKICIAAGCTISVRWFVSVMEFLLLLSVQKVRSPKKAFMDNITLLMRDQESITSVLKMFDRF